MVGIAQRMLDEAAAENAAVAAVLKRSGLEGTVHTIKWNEGVSAGAVVIEAADDRDYAGTWNILETVTFDGSVTPAPKIETVQIDGAYPVLRHRVSSIVEGGTVTSRIDGNT